MKDFSKAYMIAPPVDPSTLVSKKFKIEPEDDPQYVKLDIDWKSYLTQTFYSNNSDFIGFEIDYGRALTLTQSFKIDNRGCPYGVYVAFPDSADQFYCKPNSYATFAITNADCVARIYVDKKQVYKAVINPVSRISPLLTRLYFYNVQSFPYRNDFDKNPRGSSVLANWTANAQAVNANFQTVKLNGPIHLRAMRVATSAYGVSVANTNANTAFNLTSDFNDQDTALQSLWTYHIWVSEADLLYKYRPFNEYVELDMYMDQPTLTLAVTQFLNMAFFAIDMTLYGSYL